ncbi:LptF/LptG family permease [Roseomonas sp. BN140053]|uniref:LptF/LptG family permease n=1 Tax=Roseomonas sp. BN140053 TaxID=3391898 RepID=UPI0039E9F33A
MADLPIPSPEAAGNSPAPPSPLPVRRAPPRRRGGRPARLDRYMLAQLRAPLLAALPVLLLALLLERLLRLLDIAARTGGPLDLVVGMVVNLGPHYLGLAVPAAFFASIYVAVSRLGEAHELDAIWGTGLSLARLARPFVLLGLVLGLGGVGLYGYAQPYGRYAYRALYDAFIHAPWNVTVPAGVFTPVGSGVTVTADAAAPGGRVLQRVFVHQRHPDGTETVTTARRGQLEPTPEGGRIALLLEDGERLETLPDGRGRLTRFTEASALRDAALALPPFRPRGDDEREMLLDELWAGRAATGNAPPPATRIRSELHARLARAASLPLLALLAVPMGLAAQRSRRWHGAALAAVILVAYQHALQLGEALGDVGRVDPRPAIWGAWGIFAIFCLLVFRRANQHPSEGPFDAALEILDRGARSLGRALTPWRRAARRRRSLAAP